MCSYKPKFHCILYSICLTQKYGRPACSAYCMLKALRGLRAHWFSDFGRIKVKLLL